MRLIDEKGRLFGKINVIDLLVILLVLGLVPMVYYGHKLYVKRKANPIVGTPEVWIDVEIYCRLSKLNPETVKLLSVGDKEINGDNKTIAEILWLGKSEPYKNRFDLGAGQLLIEDNVLKEMPAWLRLHVEKRVNSLYYKEAILLYNTPFNFKTDKYDIEVIPIKETRVEEVLTAHKLKIDVILKELDSATIKSIAVGDREMDEKGDVVAEILEIGNVDNNVSEIDLGNGFFITGESDDKKQLNVKMSLKCEIGENNKLYIKGVNIMSDSAFEFKTDKYAVKAVIDKTRNIKQQPFSEKWLSVQVKFSEIIPELAKVISEGDIEKDSTNRKVGRLKSIISNRPSAIMVLRDNNVINTSHPLQKDIVCSLDILAMEKNGVFYFKNYPIKIGNSINFATDLYSITGTIVGIDTREQQM